MDRNLRKILPIVAGGGFPAPAAALFLTRRQPKRSCPITQALTPEPGLRPASRRRHPRQGPPTASKRLLPPTGTLRTRACRRRLVKGLRHRPSGTLPYGRRRGIERKRRF